MNLAQTIELFCAGTSEGALKAWEVRHGESADKWQKVGNQMGSNPGGVYKDEEGTKHYVKFYDNTERMRSENLANSIYKELGIKAPDTKLVTMDGKEAIASKFIPNPQSMSKNDITLHDDVKKGFVADAYLANHDVMGLTFDNIMRSGDSAYRIDNGGAMFYRAQGARKSLFDQHPNDVPEIDSMRNPEIAREAGQVYKNVREGSMKNQSDHLVKTLTDTKLDSLVKSAGFSGADADRYGKYLKGRRNYLAERFK